MSRSKSTEMCPIHGTELDHTHPADVENGPQPSDVYDRLFCFECEMEIDHAEFESLCIKHHRKYGSCWPCFVESEGGDPYGHDEPHCVFCHHGVNHDTKRFHWWEEQPA